MPVITSAQETVEEKLDRWTMEYAEWYARHRHLRINDLPGFTGRSYLNVEVELRPLETFVFLGATADMPYTVFERLCARDRRHRTDSDPVYHYVSLIAVRREMQGVVKNPGLELGQLPDRETRGRETDTREMGPKTKVYGQRPTMRSERKLEQ